MVAIKTDVLTNPSEIKKETMMETCAGDRTKWNGAYFDINFDNSIANDGGFFCEACLMGRSAGEQSPDPRYCRSCYEFLCKEVGMDTRKRGVDWHPRAKRTLITAAPVPEDLRRIMSTVGDQNFEVCISRPGVGQIMPGKRGPKHRHLPEAKIKELALEGLGAKAIASKLHSDGIEVSYKTVQRILSGERKQTSPL